MDPALCEYLTSTLDGCKALCKTSGIQFSAAIVSEDFIKATVDSLDAGLFSPKKKSFNCAILNPPYKKIQSSSDARLLLRRVGVETSNLYTGFLALAVRLLDDGGQIVAITPRSFCNGPYFHPFRELLLDAMSIKHVHVYESRSEAFGDDEVLQENVIIHAIKGGVRDFVTITSSTGPNDELVTIRKITYDELVRSDRSRRSSFTSSLTRPARPSLTRCEDWTGLSKTWSSAYQQGASSTSEQKNISECCLPRIRFR